MFSAECLIGQTGFCTPLAAQAVCGVLSDVSVYCPCPPKYNERMLGRRKQLISISTAKSILLSAAQTKMQTGKQPQICFNYFYICLYKPYGNHLASLHLFRPLLNEELEVNDF